MRSRRRSDPRPNAEGTSSSYEFVLAGRTLVAGRLRSVEVGIDENGWIRGVGRSLRATGRRQDLGDAVLLPSATDLHVHFRDPGGPDAAETFETGTEGAALGGVGTVGEMPNTLPPVEDREGWESKAARARGRLAVDVALYGSAASVAAVRSLAPVAAGFKLYMSPTTGADDPPDRRELRPILDAVAESGLPLAVHAESPSEFRTLDPPPASTEDWDRARPPAAEERAVRAVLSAPPRLRLHIAHATLASTVDATQRAGVSCEATPHHLLLRADTHGGADRKTNPPLRPETERGALWKRFVEGRIPILASDHAPHSLDAKGRPFATAPSGVPGVETMVPLFLELARAGECPLPVLVRSAMDHPARWLGLPEGRIAPGHWANLIAVDFRRRTTLTGRRLRSPAGWTPFEGRTAVFPTWHFQRGDPIVRDGELVGGRAGRLVRPKFATGRTGELL